MLLRRFLAADLNRVAATVICFAFALAADSAVAFQFDPNYPDTKSWDFYDDLCDLQGDQNRSRNQDNATNQDSTVDHDNAINNDCSKGPGLHVNFVNGNVWTKVPILEAYGNGTTSVAVELTYNFLCREEDGAFGKGWSQGLVIGSRGNVIRSTIGMRVKEETPEIHTTVYLPAYCSTAPPIPDPPECHEWVGGEGGHTVPGRIVPESWEDICIEPARVIIEDGDGRNNAYYKSSSTYCSGFPGPILAPAGREGRLIELPPNENAEKYELSYPDGYRQYFGFDGKPTRITSKRGETTLFAPTTDGHTVTDPYGHSIRFVIDTSTQKVTDIIHPEDTPSVPVRTHIEYQLVNPQVPSNGLRIWKIRDPMQNEVVFEYDSFNRLTKETTKNGVIFECSYEPISDLPGHSGLLAGRTITARKPESQGGGTDVVLRTAAPFYPTSRGTPSLPFTAGFEFSTTGLCYLEDGNHVVWTYVRMGSGQLVGRYASPYPSVATNYAFNIQYDTNTSPVLNRASFMRPKISTDELGLRRTYSWEATSAVGGARIKSVLTEFPSNDGTPFTIRFSYDDPSVPSQPTEKILPNGAVWHYAYNGQGDVTEIRGPMGAELEAATSVTYEYWEAGILKTIDTTNRRGYHTILRFNEQGELHKKEVQSTSQRYLVTYFEHDSAGRVTIESVDKGDGTFSTTRYDYDLLGRLLRTVVNPIGNDLSAHGPDHDQNLTTETHYDPTGLVIDTRNAKGITTHRKYDHRNFLTDSWDDYEGLSLHTQFIVDGNGNPLLVTDPKGRVTELHYDPANHIEWVLDAEGYQTKYARDGKGNVRKMCRQRGGEATPLHDGCYDASDTVPFQSVYEASYDALGRIKTVTRGLGAGEFSPASDPIITSYDYDWTPSSGCACGQGSRHPYRVYQGGVGIMPTTAITYNQVDLLGRRTKQIRKGADTNFANPQPQTGDAVTEYRFDQEDNLTELHGPSGEVLINGYDGANRLITKTAVVGTAGQELVTQLTLDDTGNVTNATLPTGNIVTYDYDGADRIKNITDSLYSEGWIEARTHDENGNVTSRTNGLGKRWDYEFDSFDRLHVVHDPVKEDPDRVTTYEYDDAGNISLVTNNNNVKTCYQYDNIDRLTCLIEDCDPANPNLGWGKDNLDGSAEGGNQAIDPEGGGNAEVSTPVKNNHTCYRYDGMYLLGISDHDGNETVYEYSTSGRTLSILFPGDASAIAFNYFNAATEQRTIQRTDQRGVTTTYQYDPLGRLAKRSYSGLIGAPDRDEEFHYDLSGRLLQANRLSPGSTTNLEYSWNRTVDPLGRTICEEQGFGADGQMYACSSTYSLDTVQQSLIQSLHYPGSTCPSNGRQIDRTFDARGRLATIDSVGLNVSWAMDVANRRVGLSQGPDAINSVFDTNFYYDDNNRLTGIDHVSNFGVLPEYAARFDYGYDPVGNRTFTRNRILTNRSERYGYDNRDRLTLMERGTLSIDGAIVNPILAQANLAGKQEWDDLDRRGNWLDSRERVNNISKRRLMAANGSNEYTCMSSQLNVLLTSDSCDNYNHATPQYDPAGNLTYNPLGRSAGDPACTATGVPNCPAGQRYVFDEENRVTEIHRVNAVTGIGPADQLLVEYKYDAIGRRVETVERVDPQTGVTLTNPRRTRHVYSGLETIQEYDCGTTSNCSDNLLREFVWGDSQRFPELVSMIDYTGFGGGTNCNSGTPPTGCVYHYIHDVLGSVIGLANAFGQLIERYTYDPYGKTYIEKWADTNWASSNVSSIGNPFGWTGQRYDPATGTYHFHFRTYSPTIGRWLQRDPAGYIDGVNLYEYVAGRSTSVIDPLGLACEEEQHAVDAIQDLINSLLPRLESAMSAATRLFVLSKEIAASALQEQANIRSQIMHEAAMSDWWDNLGQGTGVAAIVVGNSLQAAAGVPGGVNASEMLREINEMLKEISRGTIKATKPALAGLGKAVGFAGSAATAASMTGTGMHQLTIAALNDQLAATFQQLREAQYAFNQHKRFAQIATNLSNELSRLSETLKNLKNALDECKKNDECSREGE